MHDLDRTTLEYTQPQMQEGFEFQEFGGGELSEQEEVQFAHELLSVTNEQEFEQFLGDFINKVGGAIKNIASSPVGQAIGGVLKGVAKKALPMAGAALGGYIGGPLGAKIGSGLANAAGSALGLEFEAMESGEAEFEGARQFVRLAAETANNAVAAAQTGADPRKAAQTAAVIAANRLAPGLLSSAPAALADPAGGIATGTSLGTAVGQAAGAAMAMRPGHSGRWVRRGKHIVLFGV
jgi:hypothetical protein